LDAVARLSLVLKNANMKGTFGKNDS